MTLQVFLLDQNPISLNYHVLLNSYQTVYTTNLSSIRLHKYYEWFVIVIFLQIS